MTNQEESHRLQSLQPRIHRGSWLITDTAFGLRGAGSGVIEDGALLVAHGRIQAVGKYRSIANEYGQYHTQEHEGMVLAPALINSHCHLELSHLELGREAAGKKRYSGDITSWIRDLLAEREKIEQDTSIAEGHILHDARHTLQQMYSTGVGFVGDVGNSLASRDIGAGQVPRVYFLLELLGMTRKSETKALARLGNLAADKDFTVIPTAHAPYSTTPLLLQAIKGYAKRYGHIFSIHLAESIQEVEFLRFGTGGINEFLRERGAWDDSFVVPGMRAVQYLDNLGIIDDKTLCVHGVHLHGVEISILAKKRAKVCLCPGSNRFIGVGKAPVTEFLAHGILPALGTDSKASNETLNMWREMRLLREDHAQLAPELVFAMATRGGAEAWDIASELGTLAPGKRAFVLAVRPNTKLYGAQEVFEYLTTAGESVQTEWLE